MFDNTLKLTKFMLNREKVTSTAWVLSMVILNFLILVLMGSVLMPDADAIKEFMTMLENPALLAMVGPLYSMDVATMGALYTLMMFVFMGIAVAIMNIFLVVRHTRADEEAGRYEVLRSLPVGRLANVNAAMLTAVVVNVVMAVLFTVTMWLGMAIIGDPMGFNAALLWGVTLAAVGLSFAGIAALFSQLSSNSRGASGFSFMLMGLFYFLRAGADASPSDMGFLAFLSPFGISSRTWVYVNNVWWPVLVILAFAAVFTALAYKMCSIRDIDQGIIPARAGSAQGGFLLKSHFGLNFRLLRTSIIAWVVILFVIGLSYSVVLDGMDEFVAGNPAYRQMILGPTGLFDEEALAAMPTEEIVVQMNAVLGMAGLSVVQLFANMTGFFMAMMAMIPVLMFILKAKSEEKAIRTELIVATSTCKVKYLLGFVVIAFSSAVLIQIAQAVGLYSVARNTLANPSDLPLSFLIQSVLVYVPAMWIMGGITVLLVGLFPRRVGLTVSFGSKEASFLLFPRFSGLIWAFYGFTFIVMMYGRMMPEIAWMANITPLGWVPQLPMDDISWPVLIVKAVLGIALAAAGIIFYRRRDINAH